MRLDLALVARNLAETRERAQALILAGKVKVDGQKADKPGRAVTAESHLEVEQPLRYVSRGGLKLEAALAHFGIPAAGKVCLDVGTSTGGFTDCLLQHGAARVHAVDTGAGQIDWRLRNDPRVVLHERINARYLTFDEIGELVQLIACDVSFISVTLLIPALAPLLHPEGDCIILVKPQFEVGRESVGKGGIVRDPALHQAACAKVANALLALGYSISIMDSPITGAEGNREFLLHARVGQTPGLRGAPGPLLISDNRHQPCATSLPSGSFPNRKFRKPRPSFADCSNGWASAASDIAAINKPPNTPLANNSIRANNWPREQTW